MTVLLAIGIPFVYLAMVGFLYPFFKKYYYHGPPNMGRTDSATCAALSAAFFPAIMPLAIGQVIQKHVAKERPSRAERKREKEIEDAKHEAELARIKRMAHEELDRELALLDQR